MEITTGLHTHMLENRKKSRQKIEFSAILHTRMFENQQQIAPKLHWNHGWFTHVHVWKPEINRAKIALKSRLFYTRACLKTGI